MLLPKLEFASNTIMHLKTFRLFSNKMLVLTFYVFNIMCYGFNILIQKYFSEE